MYERSAPAAAEQAQRCMEPREPSERSGVKRFLSMRNDQALSFVLTAIRDDMCQIDGR